MKAPEITVVKEDKLVEYYTVRNGYEWGSIFIYSYFKGGIFSALTSFGNYSYHWGSVGGTFKEFLSQLDYCYFMGKTTKKHGTIFDFETSQKQLFKMVLDARKCGSIHQDQARDFYNFIERMDYCTDGENFCHELYNSELYDEIICDYESIPDATKPCPQCLGFWNRIYKPLIEEFKKEIGE